MLLSEDNIFIIKVKKKQKIIIKYYSRKNIYIKIFSKLFLRYECLKKFNTGCLEYRIMLMREWLGNELQDGSNGL